MKRLLGLFIAVAISLPSYPVGAKDVTPETWSWQRSGFCTVEPDPKEPGGTPLNPIKLETFGELFEISVNRDEYLLDADPKCRWVELSGLYRWEDPFGYHGSLVESFPKHLKGEGARYLIATFLPPDTRAGNFHSRNVTFVGRFYHRCVPYRKVERGENVPEILVRVLEDGTRIKRSECSHWKRRTLIIRDVFVTEIRDEQPLYISGERNRSLIGELSDYTGNDLNEIVAETREKIRLLQDSVEAYADYEAQTLEITGDFVSEERLANSKENTRLNIMRIVSFETTLHHHAAFQRLNARRAKIRVFSDTTSSLDTKYACVCLRGRCKDQWPLYESDAQRVIDPFACFKSQEVRMIVQ